MTEAVVIFSLLVGTSIVAAVLLLAINRRLRTDPFAYYWAIYWILQVPLYVVGTIYYYFHLLDGWQPLTMIPLVAAQAATLMAAGRAASGKRPSVRNIGITALIALLLMSAYCAAGGLLFGYGFLGQAFSAARGYAIAAATAFFAFHLWRSNPHPRLAEGLMILSSVAMALNFLFIGVSGSGFVVYDESTPTSSLVAILLQFGVSAGIIVRILERALGAANAAAESDRRFRALLESIGLLGIVVDKECRVEFANRYLLELTGYQVEDILGKDIASLCASPQTRDTLCTVFRQGMSTGNMAASVDGIILTRGGRERSIRWVITVLRGDSEKITGCAAVGYDVTEEREREEQHRQAQRVESIGRLAGGVAHDFNNHLTVINGYTELLMKVLPGGSTAHGFALETRAAGERAVGLTRQLLAFSRRQILEPRLISPKEIVSGLQSMLRRLLREDIEITFDLGPGSGSIMCDPSQLEQIVVNLVVNARDAIPGHGRILIQVRNEQTVGAGEGRTASLPAGTYVLVRVVDNGTGMDEETRQRVFEPFFTTKAVGKGVGLGMAVVHGIVKQSGGWIQLESQPGLGTNCSVYFPLAIAGSLDQTAAQATSSLPEEPASATVLLVEDRDDVRQLTRTILSEAGYRVTDCAGGDQAAALVESSGAAFELLVTDIVMPRMNGRELANLLKRRQPELKILFVSGYAADAVVQEGVLEPGINFLAKPYSPPQLLAKVREALAE
ncbi:MAG: ATP-binding protein [Bryobacteraceae bacterium]